MLRVIRAENGMNIFGQGVWILLFTVPAVAGAVTVRSYAPDLVALPLPRSILTPLGVALVVPGLALWLTAMVQLMRGFPRGKLVSTGAYAVCRNPIYASFGLFFLPGLSLASGTWVYLVVAAVLCLGVVIFIRKEERDLLRVFGGQYRHYTSRVHRILPFFKPRVAL